MKTYIYKYEEEGKVFTTNFRAMNWDDAEDVGKRIKCELLGEKLGEITLKRISDEQLIQELIDSMKPHQIDFKNWFNSLGE